MPNPKIGDYVLATKFDHGDCGDHWCVGKLREVTDRCRFIVTDWSGNFIRHNGFRRAETITEAEGKELLFRSALINDATGETVWQHLDRIRQRANSA